MNRLWITLLCLLILITGFPVYDFSNLHANSSSNIKYYETGAMFRNSNLEFVTPNKKATSSIRYATKAFIIQKDPKCNGRDPLTSECTPMDGIEGIDYIRIDKTLLNVMKSSR